MGSESARMDDRFLTIQNYANNQSEADSQLPWSYRNQDIEVALTGKAFRYIFEHGEENPFTLKSVLAKASIFARMSPDDKALLVDSI